MTELTPAGSGSPQSQRRLELVVHSPDEQLQVPDFSVIDLISLAFSQWRIIISVAFIGACLFGFAGISYKYFLAKEKGTTKMVVSFHFFGIEEGKDPRMKRFDKDQIINPAVLSKTVKDLKLGVTPEQLRQHLTVDPVIPEKVLEKVESLRKEAAKKDPTKLDEIYQIAYHPIEFVVKLKSTDRLNLSKEEMVKVEEKIFENYQEWFLNHYTDQELFVDIIAEINLNDYDYPEFSEIANQQISEMRRYFIQRDLDGSSFRSSETNKSFKDLISELDIIQKIDVDRMDSMVGAYKLTKNKEWRIQLIEHRILQYELNKKKLGDQQKDAVAMMEKFPKEKSIMLIPGISNTAPATLEGEKQDDYFRLLAGKALEAGFGSSTSGHDIEFYKAEIERLKNDTVPLAEKTEAIKEIERISVNIQTKLNKFTKVANATVQDYSKTILFGKSIDCAIPPQYYSKVSITILLAISIAGGMLGALVGLFLVWFRQQVIRRLAA